MDETKLTKRVFLWCYVNPEYNWCGGICKIAETLHKQQKQCIELMLTEWKNEILIKPKLRTYKETRDVSA